MARFQLDRVAFLFFIRHKFSYDIGLLYTLNNSNITYKTFFLT